MKIFSGLEEWETERHYTYLDEEVKDGLRSKGDLKEGLQLHAHVIVSRMDVTQTISLVASC